MDSLMERNGTNLFGTDYSWNGTERFFLERMNSGTEWNGFFGNGLLFGTEWNGPERFIPVIDIRSIFTKSQPMSTHIDPTHFKNHSSGARTIVFNNWNKINYLIPINIIAA